MGRWTGKDGKIRFRFEIRYFKPTGKFYASDSFWLDAVELAGGRPYMEDAFSYIRGLREAGKPLPGLSTSWADGYVLVEHGAGHPRLFPPLGETPSTPPPPL